MLVVKVDYARALKAKVSELHSLLVKEGCEGNVIRAAKQPLTDYMSFGYDDTVPQTLKSTLDSEITKVLERINEKRESIKKGGSFGSSGAGFYSGHYHCSES